MHGDIGWWVGPGKEAAAECSWAAEGQWVLMALASVGSFDVAESVMMQAMVLPRRDRFTWPLPSSGSPADGLSKEVEPKGVCAPFISSVGLAI